MFRHDAEANIFFLLYFLLLRFEDSALIHRNILYGPTLLYSYLL